MTSTADVKFCSRCGAGVELGNHFCTSCGSAIAELDHAAVEPALEGETDHVDESEAVLDPAPAAEPMPVVADPPPLSVEHVAVPASKVDDGVRERADVVAASFQFMVVRDVDTSLRPDVDGLIYPLPGSTANSVVSEPRDGSNAKRIVASGFKVLDLTGGQVRRLSEASDLRIDILITSSRVAFACSKFKKGGGWTPFGVGALPVALVLNGVSKARAASQRRGKMLVGQVRYPWLAAAGGSNKAGFGDREQLRLCVGTLNRRLLALDLTLPNNVDSTAVAAEILRRAAAYRLDSDPRAAEHSDELRSLAEAAPLPNAKGKFALRAVPGHWDVSAEGAFVGMGAQ